VPAAEAGAAAREAERGLVLGGSDSTPRLRGAEPSIWSLFKVVLVLALAAAAVYGLVGLLKRGKAAPHEDAYLKVLARTPLSMKAQAAVLAVGSRAWLVGVSDAGVSAIAEIDDRETVDKMLLAYSEKAASASAPLSFAGILRRAANVTDGAGAARPTRNPLKKR
jgi:flagellar protein FliO/FliZ